MFYRFMSLLSHAVLRYGTSHPAKICSFESDPLPGGGVMWVHRTLYKSAATNRNLQDIKDKHAD